MPFYVFVPVPGTPGQGVAVSGDRIVLGRGAGADVRLPDASVAARHATLRADGSRWLVQDEGSRTGTTLRESDGTLRKLEPNVPSRLENGSWLRIGRVWIRVFFQALPEGAEESRTARDLASALVKLGLVALSRPSDVEMRFVDGPSPVDTLVLAAENEPYLVGRGDECAVVLEEAAVSRAQCTITRRGSVVFVRAKGGVTLLGDRELPLGEEALWSPKDLLFVGRTAFGLADPVLGTLTAIEADAEVRVPDELLPACPEDELPPVKDTPEGEPPPPEVVEVETPPPPPAFAPARAPKPPTPLLSSPEFAVICLAIAVLVTSFVALGYVLGK